MSFYNTICAFCSTFNGIVNVSFDCYLTVQSQKYKHLNKLWKLLEAQKRFRFVFILKVSNTLPKYCYCWIWRKNVSCVGCRCYKSVLELFAILDFYLSFIAFYKHLIIIYFLWISSQTNIVNEKNPKRKLSEKFLLWNFPERFLKCFRIHQKVAWSALILM